MSLFDDLANTFGFHAERLRQTVDAHGQRIVEQLNELTHSSDVGRPDTGDDFKFLIKRGHANAGLTPFDNLIGQGQGGPTVGEDWLVQSICVNGQNNATPSFCIRTNTGRLIFAVVKEGMGNETTGGSVVIKQGEVLEIEMIEAGNVDFTLCVIQRKYPRPPADAGYGISQEVYEERFRAEHEVDRDLVPGHPQHGQPAAPVTRVE